MGTLARPRAVGVAVTVVDGDYATVNALAEHNVILVKGPVVFPGAAAGGLRGRSDLLQQQLGV
ncbi:MAG TPA: hypothetical protein VKG22_09900 [Stellaceae bacterium]|nr:hypothetical protein [Stellaceae bacterium]